MPQSVLACGFKSHFPHQCKGHSIFECPLFLYLGKSLSLKKATLESHEIFDFVVEKTCFLGVKSMILRERNLFRRLTKASPRRPSQYWRVGSSPISRTSVKDIRFRVSFIFVLAKPYALQYAEKLWQFHCCHSFCIHFICD